VATGSSKRGIAAAGSSPLRRRVHGFQEMCRYLQVRACCRGDSAALQWQIAVAGKVLKANRRREVLRGEAEAGVWQKASENSGYAANLCKLAVHSLSKATARQGW